MAVSSDPKKRAWTLRERGLDFDVDADKVFDSGNFATRIDDRHDYGEVRNITAGWIGERMVVIVWTQRGDKRHIISMRYCHAEEQTYWIEEAGLRKVGD